MTLWYLASPYSKYRLGLEEAFKEVSRQAALLIAEGVPVFSPIAHTHPIALHGHMDPLDHTIWLPSDEPMMKAASGLIVLMMEGWEESYGVSVEIAAFQVARKPILYMVPSEVPPQLVRAA